MSECSFRAPAALRDRGMLFDHNATLTGLSDASAGAPRLVSKELPAAYCDRARRMR